MRHTYFYRPKDYNRKNYKLNYHGTLEQCVHKQKSLNQRRKVHNSENI